jgi:hypothetical protein
LRGGASRRTKRQQCGYDPRQCQFRCVRSALARRERRP